MTFQSLIPAALDGAHAGDLVGYDKWGRPMYLPGGGARDGQVVADDGDDDDPDDVDGPDDDDEPPAAPAKTPRPSYKQLLETVATLSAQVDPEARRKLNAELRRNREVRQLLEKNQVSTTDLAAWLASRNAPPAAQELPTPAVTTPPEATGGQQESQEPASETKPAVDQAEIDRLVEEGVQARLAQDGGRADQLLEVLRVTSVETALKAIGFTGTVASAMRVLDLESVDIDDEGNVIGAAEVAEDLKREIPAWFVAVRDAPEPPPRITDGNDVDGANRTGRKPKQPGWDQQVVGRLMGGK